MKKQSKQLIYVLISIILLLGVFCAIGQTTVKAETTTVTVYQLQQKDSQAPTTTAPSEGSSTTATGTTGTATTSADPSTIGNEEFDEGDGILEGFLGDLGDGILGIITYGWKALFLILGLAFRGVVVAVIKLGTSFSSGEVSPATFIFNLTDVTKINFFDASASSSAIMASIVLEVKKWYYIVRNLSIIIILGILVYVGIRMAISTVASEEAKYKKMLKDWLVSLILVFVLHYFMVFIIYINNALVGLLAQVLESALPSGGAFEGISTTLFKGATAFAFSKGWTCTILYVMFNACILLWMLMYMKRLITVAFLIMIAPLITITYSLDKMGDGKSQALNSWMKEFCYNILIQPFHCIIYLSLMGVVLNIAVYGETTISGGILAIMIMIFMLKAEDIVKKIFGFQSSSLGSALAAGGVGMMAVSTLGKLGKSKKAAPDASKMPNMTKGGAGAGAAATNRPAGGNPPPNGGNQPPNGGNPPASGGSVQPTTASASNAQQQPVTYIQPSGKGIKGAAKTVGQGLLWAGKKTNVVMPAFMAAVGLGLTGDAKGAGAGFAAGSSIKENINNKYDEQEAEIQETANETAFEHYYNEWSALPENAGLSEDELAEKLEDLSTTRSTSLTSDSDKKMKKAYKDMEKTYKVSGKDDPSESVYDLISSINQRNRNNGDS